MAAVRPALRSASCGDTADFQHLDDLERGTSVLEPTYGHDCFDLEIEQQQANERTDGWSLD